MNNNEINNLVASIDVKGTQKFMGKEIPVVEGGFGEGQKVILAKTIAQIHNTELSEVNRKINEHIDEFELGIDLLDLKNSMENLHSLLNGIYTKQQIANSKNIYLLSEQGYMLLAGFMNTEKAKAIRKQLRREYFAMRKVLNSSEQLKSNLLLEIYNGGQNGVLASKKLTELETRPLQDTIEKQSNTIYKTRVFIDIAQMYIDVGFEKMDKKEDAIKTLECMLDTTSNMDINKFIDLSGIDRAIKVTLEKYNIYDSFNIDKKVVEKEFKVRSIKTDTGFVIKNKFNAFRDSSKYRIVNNPDGTTDLLIKNIQYFKEG